MQRMTEPLVVESYHRGVSSASDLGRRFRIAHHGKDQEHVIPSGSTEGDQAGVQPQRAADPGEGLHAQVSFLLPITASPGGMVTMKEIVSPKRAVG